MSNEYNSISDQVQSSGDIQILTSNTYLDHVYSYFGQSYTHRESNVLLELNKLSRRNGLLLHKSQSTNRDVRILLPTQIEISLEDDTEAPQEGESSPPNEEENQARFNGTRNKKKSKIFNNSNRNSQFDENDDDILIHGGQNNMNHYYYPKPETIYRRFENKNYQTFLYNFNKIAAGCYLKVMQAPQEIWQLYSLDKHLQSETNFNR